MPSLSMISIIPFSIWLMYDCTINLVSACWRWRWPASLAWRSLWCMVLIQCSQLFQCFCSSASDRMGIWWTQYTWSPSIHKQCWRISSAGQLWRPCPWILCISLSCTSAYIDNRFWRISRTGCWSNILCINDWSLQVLERRYLIDNKLLGQAIDKLYVSITRHDTKHLYRDNQFLHSTWHYISRESTFVIDPFSFF